MSKDSAESSRSAPKKAAPKFKRDRDDAFLIRLGKNIGRVRKAKGYSTGKVFLANPSLSTATLSKIERGLIDPQIGTLKRIAKVLGVTVTELLGGE